MQMTDTQFKETRVLSVFFSWDKNFVIKTKLVTNSTTILHKLDNLHIFLLRKSKPHISPSLKIKNDLNTYFSTENSFAEFQVLHSLFHL